MGDLTGRRALVTGGSRGLGLAIASRLAGDGAAITVVDLPGALDAAALPDDWQAVAMDLTAAEAEAQLAGAVAGLDRLDILVANAGMVPPWRGIADLDMAEWDRVFALNVRAVALSLKVSVERLAESGAGVAVLMASLNGYKAHPKQTLYTASKHAVMGITRAAALDLGPLGIRVNALCPGPVLTEALQDRLAFRAKAGGPDPEAAAAALRDETALGRLVTPEDVAKAAAFLASDDASGMTGVCLPVEAGLA